MFLGATTINFDFDCVNTILADLEAKAKAALDRGNIPVENQRFEYYFSGRYPKEVYSIDIPLRVSRITPDMISQLVDDFHATHEKRYMTKDLMSYIECTDWRVLGIGVMPKFSLKEQFDNNGDTSKALKSKRNAYFEELGGFTETPVYDGSKLSYRMEIAGPAIIEDFLTTTVIIPDSKVTVNKVGSYIMELS